MLVGSNPLGDDSSPELSEADRAAWQRIERALRGMRWWWLFLASAFALAGAGLVISFLTDVVFDGIDESDKEVIFVTFASMVLLFAFALFVLGLFILRMYASVRRRDERFNEAILGRLLGRMRGAWIMMCVTTAIAAAATTFMFLGTVGIYFLGHFID